MRILNLLGGIELAGVPAESSNRLLAQTKVVAFLAYMALAPTGRYQRRDLLVGLLWPELDQSHARAALRKAVLAVRTALGDDALLGRSDEELLLVTDRLSCDVRLFRERVDHGELAAALEMWHGELMPGFHLPGCAEFGSWLDSERAAVTERASAAAWALAIQLERSNDLSRAGKLARRAAKYEWSDERLLRRTMLMLQRIGDRAGALKLFEDCARRFKSELETEPSAETAALAATMRQA